MKNFVRNRLIVAIAFVIANLFFIQNCFSQVTQLLPWTNQFNGTSTATQNKTYSVPTGSGTNRLLVVAIATARTSNGSRTVTLTYGGQTLVSAAGDMASASAVQHTQLYYLNEAGLEAASGTTLSFSVSSGTTEITNVWAAVFDRVDQGSPIANSQTTTNYNNGSGTIAFTTSLTVNANEQAVEVISSVHTSSTIIHSITAATNWTLQNDQQSQNNFGVDDAVANRSIPGSTVSDASSTTFNNFPTGTTVGSMTAISLKAATPVITSLSTSSGCVGSSLTINGTNLSGATSVKIGGTSVTITGNTSTSVIVTVGTGTTGTVSVTTPLGSATSAATFTVDQLPGASSAKNDVQCFNTSTGQITVTGSGGTGPYTYSIDNGAHYLSNGGIFNGLSAGTYQIRVKDANQCQSHAVQ